MPFSIITRMVNPVTLESEDWTISCSKMVLVTTLSLKHKHPE